MKKTTWGICLGACLALTSLVVPAHAAGDSSESSDSVILRHQSVGEQAAGSQDLGGAPQLEAGAWQDLLPVTGEDSARYYRLPAVQEGENINVSAQLIIDPMNQPSSRENIKFAGELVTGDGRRCASTGTATVSRDWFDRLALARLDTGAKRSDGYTGCLAQGNDEVYLKLERTGTWQADTGIPVELRVIVEPAVDPTTLSGQIPTTLPPANVTLSGAAEPVSGGSGFSNATELAGESIHADSVLPFEIKYYKVHLAEGQRLNYRLTMGDSRDASANRLVTRTYSPLLAGNVVERDSAELSREDVGASVTRSTLSEVSRDLVDSAGQLSGLRTPGYYYITVVGAARDPRGLNPLEYELAVQVTGEAGGGGAWEPALDTGTGGGGVLVTATGGWLPTAAQFGALLGGAAVALAGFAGLWLLRRRRRT